MKPSYCVKLDTSALAVIDLQQVEDNLFQITRIEVSKGYRGQGHANSLLKQVCADADEEGVALELFVFPSLSNLEDDTGLGETSQEEAVGLLELWYTRNGFVRTGVPTHMKRAAMPFYYRLVEQRYAAPLDEFENPVPGSEGRRELRMEKFKVVGTTPKGVWIDVDGVRRIVIHTHTKRYGHPTEAEAIAAFIARKEAQLRILRAQKRDAELFLKMATRKQQGGHEI